MKSILCALDFSEASAHVIEVALEMAARKKENLVVLYAYRLLRPESEDIADYRKNMEKKAEAGFRDLAKKLKLNGDVPYEFRSEIGFLSDRIEAYIKKNPVDVIVIGQGLADSINDHRGLSFNHFIETIRIPVLVVPTENVD